MFKKKFILLIILLFFNSCGYSPIYLKNNVNKIKFDIDEINLSGDWELNNFIENSLKRYSSKDSIKKYKFLIETSYLKDSITKDLTGKTTNYKFTIEAQINIISNDLNKKYVFKESFIMENFNNELDEKKYESSNKQNLAKTIVNKLVLQLSNLE